MNHIEIHSPDLIERRGKHFGHKWLVIQDARRFRVGSVCIPVLHPWFGLTPATLNTLPIVDVHRGIDYAFSGLYADSYAARPSHEWWIGFHCAHPGDAYDRMIPTVPGRPVDRFWSANTIISTYLQGIIRDTDYVAMACRRLCEQAHMAALLCSVKTPVPR